jgi:hypothetical protein
MISRDMSPEGTSDPPASGGVVPTPSEAASIGGTPESPPCCRTCRFWRQAGRGGPGPDWGLCKRMPPVLPEIDDEKMVHVGIWPSTEAKDWCGEWQPVSPGHAAAER